MPLLLVRNTAQGPTVWAKRDRDTLVWGPAGTENSIRRVPESMLEDPDFLDAIDGGVLVVEQASAAIDQELAELSEFRQRQRAQREQDLDSVLDRRQERQTLAEHCVGPGPSGRSTGCPNDVLRPAKERDETPPLCPQHAGMINEFALSQDGSAGNEQDPLVSRWVRVDFGPARGRTD